MQYVKTSQENHIQPVKKISLKAESCFFVYHSSYTKLKKKLFVFKRQMASGRLTFAVSVA